MRWLIIFILILGVGYMLVQRFAIHSPQHVEIHEKTYALEVVTTDAGRAKGLGERDSLCADCAMLFIFEKAGDYPFWMKGMRFPLDIVWLRGDEIVTVHSNAAPNNLNLYHSDGPADRVLEVNAGEAKDWKAGDRARYFP